MKHKVKLEWNAFMIGMNHKDRLEVFNVITDELINDIEKAYKKKELNKLLDLYNLVDKYFRWRYWGKVEYEMVAGTLFDDDTEWKIDVYWQLDMNMGKIVDYINREMQIGLK